MSLPSGSANNRQFIDDSYSAKRSLSSKNLWPACGKSYVQKRNLVLHRKKNNMDNGLRLPYPQSYKKFTISGDFHCQMSNVHLKIKHCRCETCKNVICAQERALARRLYKVNALADVCDHCRTAFKSTGSLQYHARLYDVSLPYPCNKCFACFQLCWGVIARNAFVNSFTHTRCSFSHSKLRRDNYNRQEIYL